MKRLTIWNPMSVQSGHNLKPCWETWWKRRQSVPIPDVPKILPERPRWPNSMPSVSARKPRS